MRIAYHDGYKYQLTETYSAVIAIKPLVNIDIEYVALNTDGVLTVRKGYAWDGPSGPTFDTKTFMRGSLVHDALYQLIRGGYLDEKIHRPMADAELKRICKEDGMCSFRAWYVFVGVEKFASPAASPRSEKPVLYAP